MVRRYLTIKPIGYVYCTTNNLTGEKYIGQHKGEFTPNYMGRGIKIKEKLKEYKRSNFSVTLLQYAYTPEELDMLEIKYIKELNTIWPNGYNLQSGGRRKNWKIQSNQSEIVKQAWKDGKYNNRTYTDIEEKRYKCGNGWRGRKFSEEHKKKISESMKRYREQERRLKND